MDVLEFMEKMLSGETSSDQPRVRAMQNFAKNQKFFLKYTHPQKYGDQHPLLEYYKPLATHFSSHVCLKSAVNQTYTETKISYHWDFQQTDGKRKDFLVGGKLNLSQCINLKRRGCDPMDALDILSSEQFKVTTQLYTTGRIISIIGLSAATFIWNIKVLKCWRNTLHCNLAVSSLLYYFFYLSWVVLYKILIGHDCYENIWLKNLTSKFIPLLARLCQMSNIIYLYGFLCTYFWMFVEGLNIYMICFHVYFSVPKKIYFFVGWGLPAMPLIAWVICMSRVETDMCFVRSPNRVVDEGDFDIKGFELYVFMSQKCHDTCFIIHDEA